MKEGKDEKAGNIFPITEYCHITFGNELSAQQKPQEVSSCLECHGNAAKMKEMGFSQFAVTQQEVEKQTKMPASCTDCHLGNPKDAAKDGAHKGLLRLYYVKLKGFQAVTRDKLEKFKPESLEPRGKNPVVELLPMVEKDGKPVKDPAALTILFHDKNPETLSHNYPVQEKDLRCLPSEAGGGIQEDRNGPQC